MKSPYRHPLALTALVASALLVAVGIVLILAAPRPKTHITIHTPGSPQSKSTSSTSRHDPHFHGNVPTPPPIDVSGVVETDSIRVRFNIPESKPPTTAPGGAPTGAGY